MSEVFESQEIALIREKIEKELESIDDFNSIIVVSRGGIELGKKWLDVTENLEDILPHYSMLSDCLNRSSEMIESGRYQYSIIRTITAYLFFVQFPTGVFIVAKNYDIGENHKINILLENLMITCGRIAKKLEEHMQYIEHTLPFIERFG